MAGNLNTGDTGSYILKDGDNNKYKIKLTWLMSPLDISLGQALEHSTPAVSLTPQCCSYAPILQRRNQGPEKFK